MGKKCSSTVSSGVGSAAKQKVRTGPQIIFDTLLDLGVDTLFGPSGAAVSPLFDRLADAPFRCIFPRHEQGGCHMADAYARASGKVGVILATHGPGICSLTTGLATAMMDSSPLVVLIGQDGVDLFERQACHEANTMGITRAITKYTCAVKDITELERNLREAFHVAATGRPGPVVVDLSADLSVARTAGNGTIQMELPGYRLHTKGHARQIAMAARAINKSNCPVLYVGGGVISAGATQELRTLVEKAKLPVTMTLMGLGAFDQSRPESLDMLGVHGAAYANYAVQACDLLVAVGARFDGRVTGKAASFAPNAKVVHIDIDPASISKNRQGDIPVVGDAKWVLGELTRQVVFRDRAPWLAKIAEWKRAFPFCYDQSGSGIKPQFVIEEVHRQTKGRAIVTTGVGQHQMWAAQFYRFSRARQFITSGGMGTTGFGLPAAIGAQLADPHAVVVDFDGEHNFIKTAMELSTAVEHQLPLKICILNNQCMGWLRQRKGRPLREGQGKGQVPRPDIAKLAEAMGAIGLTVTEKGRVPQAIEQMLAERRPCLLDFMVDCDENVWPMVLGDRSLDEMEGLDVLQQYRSP
ncbi:MAG: biosynthetic-type acetolactate synthase large subunit [Planctomycetes bacterium]|nr:biosynthetic-type acetolactate synthase large subunit [Planctomycetota bacterium]